MRKHLLSFVVLVGSAFPAVAAPDKPLTYEERADLTVRLRILEIDIRHLYKKYEADRQRERDLQLNFRLDQVKQELKEIQDSADKVRQQLVDLETEHLKLLDRLGGKDTAEPTGRDDATLDKILDVLMKIDKRLENLERRIPPR